MKIPNKRELEQITYNHSSDIDFKVLQESLQKMSFLVIDANLASDNPSHCESFRKNIKNHKD